MLKASRIYGMRFPEMIHFNGVQYHLAHTTSNRAYLCNCVRCVKLKNKTKYGLLFNRFMPRNK